MILSKNMVAHFIIEASDPESVGSLKRLKWLSGSVVGKNGTDNPSACLRVPYLCQGERLRASSLSAKVLEDIHWYRETKH